MEIDFGLGDFFPDVCNLNPDNDLTVGLFFAKFNVGLKLGDKLFTIKVKFKFIASKIFYVGGDSIPIILDFIKGFLVEL
jgi:hypothetical protein